MDSKRLEEIFNDCFRTERTLLIGGADEPFYLAPAHQSDGFANLYYRSDYVSSALHETAHWCIAGPERRRQNDFGYWYHPDGRGAAEQRQFYQYEIKPQALEWILSDACRVQFNFSADNLGAAEATNSADFEKFCTSVMQQKDRYIHRGLPPRAQRLIEALRAAVT